MNRLLRKIWLPALLSIVASVIGLTLYRLPLDTLPAVNRIADYSILNYAWQDLSGSSIAAALHIPVQDVDRHDDRIRLIRIDEESIGNKAAGLGGFPFPRSVWGKLLDRLHQAGARVVGFDVDFIDPPANPIDDVNFAAGLRKQPTVLPFVLNTTSGSQLGVEPLDPNLAPFVAGQGYTTVGNPGGILLGQPYTIDTAKVHFTSFATRTAAVFAGKKVSYVNARRGLFGDTRVPLLDGEMLLLPFHREERQDISQRVGAADTSVTFMQGLSLADALTEPIPDLRDFVSGRAVLVGATAQALGDFISTPFGRFPGVYTNARFIDQLINEKFIAPAPDWFAAVLIFALPLLLMLTITQSRHATAGAAISILFILAYAAATIAYYSVTFVWIDTIHVAIAMLLSVMFVSIYRIARETADRRMVTNLFGMHVSPAIVSDILSSDDPRGALALKGKKVKATIFYSDIRGFTAMSETMTPEDIYAQLNEYFEEMCAIIFQYGGYVDKFIGDCVMAVFSAPYQTPYDAKNAVLAAVAQQKKIKELAEKWKAMGKREFTVGMGVNTGDVVMGNLGASSRMNYTVIGDNVNLAARLYNVAKAGEIIISDYTYQEVRDLVVAEEREPVLVKGKKDPIKIYNITDVKEGVAAPTNGAVAHAPQHA